MNQLNALSNCVEYYERIYKIEMTDANAGGAVRKIGHIDLMKIADPDKKVFFFL